MQLDNEVKIKLTSSAADFAVCARMMAETDPWITLGMEYNYCLMAFEGAAKEIFVVKKETEIIGFVVMQTGGTFKGYIQTICINDSHRGAGYGTKILQFCQDRIFQYSPNIFICVSSFNKKALELYTRFGFELIGDLKNFIKPGFTELLLRKTIGPITGYQPSGKTK